MSNAFGFKPYEKVECRRSLIGNDAVDIVDLGQGIILVISVEPSPGGTFGCCVAKTMFTVANGSCFEALETYEVEDRDDALFAGCEKAEPYTTGVSGNA